jgi:hypothetical protein
MSPLQKIAMGLLIVFWTAPFSIDGYAWDGLPDPIGWILVLVGVHALRRHLDVELAIRTAWVALAASVPQWIPPVFEALLPNDDAVAEASVRWFFFLPQALFCLLLARAVAQAAVTRQPRDRFVAGRFGVLTWAAGTLIALPPIAYGLDEQPLIDATLIGIVLIGLAFVYYLFRVHRRTWLGGPGPVVVHPGPRASDS